VQGPETDEEKKPLTPLGGGEMTVEVFLVKGTFLLKERALANDLPKNQDV